MKASQCARSSESLAFRWEPSPAREDERKTRPPVQECVGARNDGLIDRDTVLAPFGGMHEFVRFHRARGEKEHHLDIREEHRGRPKLTESEALDVAEEVLGSSRVVSLKAEPKTERDDGIRELREAGLSARQIMRLTSISLGAISRTFSGAKAR